MDEPTQGIDVGAKEDVHRLMVDFTRKGGGAILLISSDLPEVLRMSDRILVMREGSIVGELARRPRRPRSASCSSRSAATSKAAFDPPGSPARRAAGA